MDKSKSHSSSHITEEGQVDQTLVETLDFLQQQEITVDLPPEHVHFLGQNSVDLQTEYDHLFGQNDITVDAQTEHQHTVIQSGTLNPQPSQSAKVDQTLAEITWDFLRLQGVTFDPPTEHLDYLRLQGVTVDPSTEHDHLFGQNDITIDAKTEHKRTIIQSGTSNPQLSQSSKLNFLRLQGVAVDPLTEHQHTVIQSGTSNPHPYQSSKMEGRKWEDLNMDCLVNVFGRVGIESLLLDVPLVCKSWYKATLSSLCWQRLVFPYHLQRTRLVGERQDKWWFNPKRLIMFVVNRSQRSAIELVLPRNCTEEVLIHVSEECPALKLLALPFDADYNPAGLISKWKNLEMLRLGSSENMQEILGQISINCNNFGGLRVTGANVGTEEAFAIVTYLPNIKYLFLRQAYIKRENLVMILEGCKELVHLDVSDCIGFEEDDEEILKLASHITTFKYEGSTTYDYDDDMYDHISVDTAINYGSD